MIKKGKKIRSWFTVLVLSIFYKLNSGEKIILEKTDILTVGKVKMGKRRSFLKLSNKLNPIAALPTAWMQTLSNVSA